MDQESSFQEEHELTQRDFDFLTGVAEEATQDLHARMSKKRKRQTQTKMEAIVLIVGDQTKAGVVKHGTAFGISLNNKSRRELKAPLLKLSSAHGSVFVTT